MLEHYFVRLSTVDRLRAMWLGPAFDRYAERLASRQASKNTALGQLQVLAQFNEFVVRRGVRDYAELPGQLDPFVKHRMRVHGKWCRNAKDRRTVRSDSRAPVEQ